MMRLPFLSALPSGARTAIAAFFGLFLSIAGASAQTLADPQGLNLSSSDPVQIDGDRLEMREDEGLAIFDGNVTVVQGKTIMRTGKLVIYYVKSSGGNGLDGGQPDIDRLEVSGGVNIQTGTQIATGDRGVYDMASEVLVLTGERVTLTEGGNIATGCKLTVTMADNRARLEGCGKKTSRPTVLIQPRSIKRN